METNPSKEPTIQITTRTERTLYTLFIHLVTRPFRTRLGRPKKKQPKGSLGLQPYKRISKTCNVTHRTVCDINVYDIAPKTLTSKEARKHIYYFCGGGWQSPPSNQHWQLCAKLAHDIPDTMVSLVSYPLAPNNPAPVTFPWLVKFYRAVMEAADAAGEKVILAGDSAGGNIVLSIVLEAVREDSKVEHESQGIAHPVCVMAINPSTDLTRRNPDIDKVAKNDPILTPPFVKNTAKAWQGDWDPEDRRLSPLHAETSLLARNGVQIHGITSGYDVLSPDGILFRDKLAKEGVQGQWLHWEKQMHCFVLTQPYGLPEAKEATKWIVNVLKAA